jgi:cytochrome c556
MGISAQKKRLLCEFVGFKCEECHKEFTLCELEIHRINREWQGGTYNDFRNLKVCCSSCHSLYHANEFVGVKSK